VVQCKLEKFASSVALLKPRSIQTLRWQAHKSCDPGLATTVFKWNMGIRPIVALLIVEVSKGNLAAFPKHLLKNFSVFVLSSPVC
jgi:hypothetical protein